MDEQLIPGKFLTYCFMIFIVLPVGILGLITFGRIITKVFEWAWR